MIISTLQWEKEVLVYIQMENFHFFLLELKYGNFKIKLFYSNLIKFFNKISMNV